MEEFKEFINNHLKVRAKEQERLEHALSELEIKEQIIANLRAYIIKCWIAEEADLDFMLEDLNKIERNISYN